MTRHRARVIRSDHKLQVIKLIRQLNDAGLKQAKDWVDGQQWFELELDEHKRALLDEHLAEFHSQIELDPPLAEVRAPESPAGPIDQRLLDPRFAVRAHLRYVQGPNKISAIKLARELTGLGLKDAKDLIEAAGWVCRDIPIEEAGQIERRFGEFGSRVEIVPCSITVIAFDPRHVLRAEQPLVRMRVTGPRLAIDHGRLNAWETASAEREFDTPEQLRVAVEAQRDAWTAAGLELEGDALALLLRLSAREPWLERQIREAEDPRESSLVYSDWLSAQGDPRGELGPLQAAGAEEASRAALTRHATQVFGPLAGQLSGIELRWHVGLVWRVEFNVEFEPAAFDSRFAQFRMLLALPVLACVRELVARGVWLSQSDPIAAIPSEVRGGLRSVTLLTDNWSAITIAEWSELTRLEALHLSAGRSQLGALQLPSLRHLSLRTQMVDDTLVRAFADGMLGALEQLELRLAYGPHAQGWIDDYGDALAQLLRATPLPRLRDMQVHVEQGGVNARFVNALFDAPFVHGLERLQLRTICDDSTRELFERRRQQLSARLQVATSLHAP